ncbi:MAG: hypothetical protein ACRD6W_15530, partial [Nitrososphaerales archaeon]
MHENPATSPAETPDRNRPAPVPGSGLVTCFPESSGHGSVTSSISRLELFEETVLYKIRTSDSAQGFLRVVQPG